MKSKSNRFLALASLASALATLSASAAIWQWDGGAATDNWQTPVNWNPDTTVANFNGTYGDRLNVNGAQALTYSAAEGTTNYGGASIRGVVVGSGGAGSSGTLNITGGTFSSLNAEGTNSADIIGNGDGNTGSLNISGGTFFGASTGTSMNLGGSATSGRVSNLTVSGTGTATLTSLFLNGATINVNLNGGLLELNGFTNTSITVAAKIRLNGGTLKARQANASFIAANGFLETLVQSGGAVIDTNGFGITIAEPLLEDAGSTGGGLIKNGAGLLTLSAPSTTTGATDVNAGGLAIKAGASSWTPSSFSHSGDLLNIDLGVYDVSNQVVIDTGALTVDSAVTVNVTGSKFVVGQIPLISYTSKSITGSLTLNPASLPANVVATLEDDGSQIYLDVTSAPTTYVWSGASGTPGTGDWDTTSSNWDTFTNAYSTSGTQIATFPDITGGGTVNIADAYSPLIVNISNASGNPYTFNGTGKITGTGVLNKSGTGIATFANGTNDYSGATTISAGAIIKQAADSTTGDISVSNGAMLVLKGGVTDGAGQTITITGPGTTASNYFYTGSAGYRGALQSQSGSNTWAGDIVVIDNGDSRIGVQGGASLTLTGNISGAVPRFRAGGAGEDITLSGVGSWTGDTIMYSTGGAIKLGADDSLPTGTRIYFTGSGTVFDLNGHNQQLVGMTSYNPTVINNGASPSVLTLSPLAATNHAFYGYIKDGTAAISVVKSGDGTNSLEGNNTYTGTTTVNSGTLLINSPGVLHVDSNVTVNGGILGGTGTINGPITVGALGTLAPGVTTGVLHVASVDLSSGATLAIDMNDAATVKTDLLEATDTIDVTNAKLVFNVTGALAETSYILASASTITGTISPGDVTGLPAGYTLVQDGFEIRLDQAAGYTTWAAANANGQTADLDADYDGVANGVEYFLGETGSGFTVSPTSFTGNTATWTNGGNIPSTDYSIQFWIQTSTDLVNWTDVADTDTNLDNQPGSVSYTLTGSGKEFMRLVVSPN